MTGVRLTHIGGPTVLIQFGGWRLLTDPTFDPPGQKYNFGWGTGSVKLAGPSVCSRWRAPSSRRFPARGDLGVRREGSSPGPRQCSRLRAGRRSRPLAGDVIGFALGWEGQEHGVLWISGDTVLYDGVRQVADRLQVGTALLHLGGAQFPVTGPLRYTMTAKDAVELCGLIRPRTAIPIHYEGWKHFKQDRQAIERQLERAPQDARERIRWLPVGVEVEIAA